MRKEFETRIQLNRSEPGNGFRRSMVLASEDMSLSPTRRVDRYLLYQHHALTLKYPEGQPFLSMRSAQESRLAQGLARDLLKTLEQHHKTVPSPLRLFST